MLHLKIRQFLIFFFIIFLLPVCWLPLYLYRGFVILLARLRRPDLKRIFTPADITVEEAGIAECCGYIPKCSLVNSITLEEPISIQELRDLFQNNVLQARMPLSLKKSNSNNNSQGKIRYPELQQFPVSFMGYSFWKRDEDFQIQDHILEQSYQTGKQPTLAMLHEQMINKPFVQRRSPWEIILINNYRDEDDCYEVENGEHRKGVIIARFHHSMADAKSLLKLFVECLGGKPLKIAQPQNLNSSHWIKDIFMVPINYANVIAFFARNMIRYWSHPWKCNSNNSSSRRTNKHRTQLVRMSNKLSLKDVKEIGKKSGGTASSVILAIVSGSIRKIRPDIGEMYSGYILPKDGHPATLVNHARLGALILPTDDDSPLGRLEKSNHAFKKLKASNMGKYTELPVKIVATTFNPLRTEILHELSSMTPMGITNIAGEMEGFSIGRRQCSEFIFSVGRLTGDMGVVFCISSYKDYFRIAVIAEEGILEEGEADQLVTAFEKELDRLKEVCS